MIDTRPVKWGEIGFITFARTYAREKNGKKESFSQAVERQIKGIETQLKLPLTQKDKELFRDMTHNMWGSCAGRFLWQLGSKTVDQLGLSSLQNCAFVVVDEPVRPFTWTMDMLMLGSGVGYSIQRKHVDKIPKVAKNAVKVKRVDNASADFIVPDTREGWVKLLGKTMKAYLLSGKGFTYSCQLVRGEGEPIKGFGGVASGPAILEEGITSICQVLDKRRGKKLRPIDCLDVMNIIGDVVKAGNVRRSAQIAIGDPDDLDFLRAKRWDLGTVPKWRELSNNSVACSDIDQLPEEFWETYKQGEAYGLINIDLLKKVGRSGDTRYPDPKVEGVNPCGEQGLADHETCCLAETFLPNIPNYETFLKVLTLLYRINKHSLALKCHHEETQEVVNSNMRMGISVTGVYAASLEQLNWLEPAYEYLRAYDKEYSEGMGWPTSVKLTTIKPSGTLSLLAGVTPGAHPAPAGEYYIRRIRISSSSPLVDLCRAHGYYTEYARRIDKSEDKSTVVVEFPCKFPEGTPSAADIDPIDHLEMVKFLQRSWSDNSVSVSVYYRVEDIDRIKQYLKENFKNGFKTLSFMLYHGHGFDQAPYEPITKEQYEFLSSKVKPIETTEFNEEDLIEIGESCGIGGCPIK